VLNFDQAFRELESAVAVALGEQENGTARLEAAVVAFRAALEEYKHDQMPLDWAMTQNNLGNTLWRLGEREKRIWKRRPQHRIKHRLEPDLVPGVELVARARDMKPHSARLTSWVKTDQGIGLDDDAPAVLGQVDVDDPSGEGDRS
jgi:hypothetical protein